MHKQCQIICCWYNQIHKVCLCVSKRVVCKYVCEWVWWKQIEIEIDSRALDDFRIHYWSRRKNKKLQRLSPKTNFTHNVCLPCTSWCWWHRFSSYLIADIEANIRNVQEYGAKIQWKKKGIPNIILGIVPKVSTPECLEILMEFLL